MAGRYTKKPNLYSWNDTRYRLHKNERGFYYVVDPEVGFYLIKSFLGDVAPICQVFEAYYFNEENMEEEPQVVALKLARIDDSAEFHNLLQEIRNSVWVQPEPNDCYLQYDDYVPSADHHIVGILKSFYYRGFLCISMPHVNGEPLRYIIDNSILDERLPPECVALVLKEVLRGLHFLHVRGRIHSNLNAGNIFVRNFHGSGEMEEPLSIQLGYQATTYFYHPGDLDSRPRIWDDHWDPSASESWAASNFPVNKFWRIQGIYEPRSIGQNVYSPKSDIWNLGVTALELSLGAFTDFQGNPDTADDLRTRDEFRAFLTKLCSDEEMPLPKLFELFLPDPGSRETTTRKCIAFARKICEDFVKIMEKFHGSEPEGNIRLNLPNLPPESSPKAMVKKCLAFNPDERPTAEKLLADPYFRFYELVDMPYFKNFMTNRRKTDAGR